MYIKFGVLNETFCLRANHSSYSYCPRIDDSITCGNAVRVCYCKMLWLGTARIGVI